jgi:hypothetical protein
MKPNEGKKIKMAGFCAGNCGEKFTNHYGFACYAVFGRLLLVMIWLKSRPVRGPGLQGGRTQSNSVKPYIGFDRARKWMDRWAVNS